MSPQNCWYELVARTMNMHGKVQENGIIVYESVIRPLSKLAYAEGFEGDAEPQPAAYSDVREDSSTASTYKSPAEVEFQKRSIEESENGQKSKEIDQKGALDILYPAPKQDDIKRSRNDIEGSGNDIEDWVPNLFLINKITKNTKQNYLVNFPLIVNDHLEYTMDKK